MQAAVKAEGVPDDQLQVASVETTPNPASLKFNLSHPLPLRSVTLQAADFKTPETAALLPAALQQALLVEGVDSIYVMGDWVTVNRSSKSTWQAMIQQLVNAFGGPSPSADFPDLPEPSTPSSSPDRTASPADIEGVLLRVQEVCGIPIQVEAKTSQGLQRQALGGRFKTAVSAAMAKGSEFFQNRKWVDRGRVYPEAGGLEGALKDMVAELEAAFSEDELEVLVQRLGEGGEQRMRNLEGVAELSAGEQMRAVTQWADVAANQKLAVQEKLPAVQALAELALDIHWKVPSRRLATAALGMVGDNSDLALSAIPALEELFLSDKLALLRRTAGDALSDLGLPEAVPLALQALKNDKSRLVRWRAARICAELGTEEETLQELLQVREQEREFEVQLELDTAIDRISALVTGAASSEASALKSGPAWLRMAKAAQSAQA